MFVYQIEIKPASSGFNEWEAGHNNSPNPDDSYDLADLLGEIDDDYYLLGSDELPDDIVDIRGAVHNEPTQIYAIRRDWGIQYLGIEEA